MWNSSKPYLKSLFSFLLSGFLVTSAFADSQVVITGSREPLAPERLAADVIVISADVIKNSTADSLGDLLRREAGVQLVRAGGPGQGTSAMIRGANGGQTVVLIDGARVGSATLGLAALEQISLSSIDRVEILRGPGSSIYGADAVGGVVQIFTHRGDELSTVAASLAQGGYGSRIHSLAAGTRQGDWDASAAWSRESSRGVSVLKPGDRFGNYNPDADGYSLETFQAQWGFKPTPSQRLGVSILRTSLNAQYDASEYLAPTYAPDPSADFRNRVVSEVAALDWRGQWELWRWSARVAHSADDARQGASSPDRYQTVRNQGTVQASRNWTAWGQTVIALEKTDERAQSSSYYQTASRNNGAIVGAWTGHSGSWSWQADARRDHSNDYGDVNTARLGGVWALDSGLKIRALWGNTFRAPSFNDLVYPGYGVPTLRPERGQSIEWGVAWKRGALSSEATMFNNRVRDLIGYEGDRSWCPKDPSYDYGCARNINQAHLRGLSLKGQWAAGPWNVAANWEFLDAKDALTGIRLSRRAASQGQLRVQWTRQALQWSATMMHLGGRPDAGQQLAPETTLDGMVQWQFEPRWAVQFKLLNATDQATVPSRDYQGLGRQAWVILRYESPGR